MTTTGSQSVRNEHCCVGTDRRWSSLEVIDLGVGNSVDGGDGGQEEAEQRTGPGTTRREINRPELQALADWKEMMKSAANSPARGRFQGCYSRLLAKELAL